MSPATTDWLLWISAGALGLAAALLLAWSLFWDRARGRRRCPRCWYNLEGATQQEQPTCPECGRIARNARALRRTRRRWRWAAVAALLGVLAYAAGLAPTIRKTGWLSAVPTTALIILCSPSDWVAESASPG